MKFNMLPVMVSNKVVIKYSRSKERKNVIEKYPSLDLKSNLKGLYF